MEFLYLLENIRTPFWDAFFSAVTYLGDEIFFMAIAIAVYWCVDKKWGYYLLTVGFFGTLINQFAKIMCRVPRPWVRDPNFTIVESARSAAGGYSFPSGHTANISGTLGSIAMFTRKKVLSIVLCIIIALVSFSRMYLGVHTPADVGFSLLMSAILVFGLYPFFAKYRNDSKRMAVIIAILTVLSLCFALFVELNAWDADIDAANLAAATKNAWLLTGCGSGMLLSLWIDTKYVNFSVKAPLWAQILKVVLGLLIILAIRMGLKPVFAAIFGGAAFADALRYFCMVVFAAGIWPMSFRWFASGCKVSKRK